MSSDGEVDIDHWSVSPVYIGDRNFGLTAPKMDPFY